MPVVLFKQLSRIGQKPRTRNPGRLCVRNDPFLPNQSIQRLESLDGDQSMTNVQTQAPLLDSNPAATLRLGLSLRAAQWADLNSVAKLIYAVCEADGDTTVAVTPQELKL